MREDVTAQDAAEDDSVVREIVSAKEKRAKSSEPREPREPKAITDLRNDDARSVTDWLRELSPSGAVRVTVSRLSPESWGGVNTGGVVGTYERTIDEDWVREHHGGGTYQLTVRIPHPKRPGWIFTPGGTRQIRIAGDPRTDDVFRDKVTSAPPPVASGPSSDVVKQVVMSMERQLERAHSNGPDIATMQALLAPLQQQLEQMGRMLSEKDRQLSAAQQVKPEQDPFRDKMIASLLDGDTARIAALRAQYESELRQAKQSSIDNEARLRDGFDRDKQSLAMAHDRELKSLSGAHAMTVAAKDQSAATSQMLLEAEIRRLTADNVETKAELVALRARKDKTQIETLQEAVAIRNMADELGGGGKTDEKSGWDKAAELLATVAGSNPAVQGLVTKVVGGEATEPIQPPPTIQVQPRMRRPPPQHRHFTGPDGNLYRKQPDGAMELEAARPPGQPAIPQISPATVKLAVDFLEAACRNGQDPAEVATSVRSMIPADVLTAIRELGIDGFLSTLAKLDGTSPLSSQAGRNWTRKLGKALVGE